jgi:integrase
LQVAHWARLKWEGVDLQELLGHANIFITLNTYSHVLPGMVEQTAIVMENVLS